MTSPTYSSSFPSLYFPSLSSSVVPAASLSNILHTPCSMGKFRSWRCWALQSNIRGNLLLPDTHLDGHLQREKVEGEHCAERENDMYWLSHRLLYKAQGKRNIGVGCAFHGKGPEHKFSQKNLLTSFFSTALASGSSDQDTLCLYWYNHTKAKTVICTIGFISWCEELNNQGEKKIKKDLKQHKPLDKKIYPGF